MSVDLDMDKYAYRKAKDAYIDTVRVLIPRLQAFINRLECQEIEFDEWLAGDEFLTVDDIEKLLLQYVQGIVK